MIYYGLNLLLVTQRVFFSPLEFILLVLVLISLFFLLYYLLIFTDCLFRTMTMRVFTVQREIRRHTTSQGFSPYNFIYVKSWMTNS